MDDHDLAQIKYYIQRSSDSEIFSDYQKCNVNISYGEACVPSKKAQAKAIFSYQKIKQRLVNIFQVSSAYLSTDGH